MSLAADLIATGVFVAAQDEECDLVVQGLNELLRSEGDEHGAQEMMLRAVVAALRDAANGAIDVHDGAPDVSEVTLGRMRRFALAMSAALKEIS
jgi:hypothetical protein